MRRLTKAAPIGGASACNFCNSSAYSGGSRSGIVAMSCATFMIGPFKPPSAAVSALALRWSLPSPPPNRREPTMRAATPPTLAPTRA